MKKLSYLIVLTLILGLVLTGCLLSNVGQIPTNEQSGVSYLTKGPYHGLVGLWHFDDDDALDYSGNLNHGTLMGDTSWISGKFGNALSFDGDDYVVVSGSTSMNVSSSYTFEAWINLSSEGTVYRGFFRRGDLGTLASEIEIYTQPTNRRLTVAHNRGGTFCYKYFTAFPLDQWVHLVVTWDGALLKAYYNNVEQLPTGGSVTIVSPATSDPAKPNYIGVGYCTAYMNGTIDEVRVWNEVLDSAQIGQSYNLSANTTGVTELSHQDLSDGGVAIFTSAFYVERLDLGEVVDVNARAMIVGSDAVVDGYAERGMTPKGAIIIYNIYNPTDTGFDITASRSNNKAKSLHLSMLLDTDEGLGVNVQFLPYD